MFWTLSPNTEKKFVESDPDIVVSWEPNKDSLLYILERARRLDPPLELARSLSRAPQEPASSLHLNDTYMLEHNTDIKLTGRVVLSVWRLVTRGDGEIKLPAGELNSLVPIPTRSRVNPTCACESPSYQV